MPVLQLVIHNVEKVSVTVVQWATELYGSTETQNGRKQERSSGRGNLCDR